jgi:amino acid adenylation domain-containing protein
MLVHELFESQVSRSPEALAVACDHSTMTYAELNHQANRIAMRLRECGVIPEQRVALYCERGVNAIAGVLGILKAGGVYVPIDPAYPSDRIAFILQDSAPAAVLTQANFATRLWSFEQALLILDDERGGLAENQEVNELTAHSLAYVIYTSGSTGKPKGVMIEHRSACNLVAAQIEGFGIQPDSRVLQFAPLSFDASISEIFVTLCRGASLHIPSPGSRLIGESLAEILIEHRITHVTLPPSVLRSMRRSEKLSSVATLISAGEACHESLVNEWAPGRCFINAYGPTETAVCATLGECKANEGSPGIGRPIQNASIYILDENQQPVPAGVIGELYIGGIGVARGYQNRSDLTLDRFLPNLFDPKPGGRLYRTGDLGRWRPGGTIEYAGRKDHQVKVRGFRIEPSEIEDHLGRSPLVEQTVVLAEDDAAGEKELVAYVVTQSNCRNSEQRAKESVASLRAFLTDRLPAYMVPSFFVLLEEMPLTVNGKVDRERLLIPREQYRPKAQSSAGSDTERALTEIWERLLNAKALASEDHFFELGGNSYLALKLAAEMSARFALSIRDITVYQHPTLRGMASYVETTMRSLNSLGNVAITPSATDGAVDRS